MSTRNIRNKNRSRRTVPRALLSAVALGCVLASHAPRESRLAWLGAVREAAEARCIGWAHWDFDSSFGLIDDATGLPDQGVMQALVPR